MKVAPKKKSKTTSADFAQNAAGFTSLAVIKRESGKAGASAGTPRLSRNKRSIAVQRRVRDIKLACPWLEIADMPLVKRLAESSVIADRLYWEIHLNGAFDSKRQPRYVLETYSRFVKTITSLCTALGMSPVSRKQLALGAPTDDLAAALAKRVSSSDSE